MGEVERDKIEDAIFFDVIKKNKKKNKKKPRLKQIGLG